jgi:hypothetical protein
MLWHKKETTQIMKKSLIQFVQHHSIDEDSGWTAVAGRFDKQLTGLVGHNAKKEK